MSSNPEIIGQGTFGCVHKPSLRCKNKSKMKYDNKVSKTLSKQNANIEMKEYKGISEADRDNDFYLGRPTSCEIDDIHKNKEAIAKCKIGADVLSKLSNYKLIIMDDGGENLETYSKTVKEWPTNPENKKKCELFLLETLRLFQGLLVFKNHGLIHHDLKPQNIVYNETEKRLNFIDFGIMQSKEKVKNLALRGGYYEYGIFHWSFPWEAMFLNKGTFDRRLSYKTNWLAEEYKKSTGNSVHMQNFFYYTVDRYLPKALYDFKINRAFREYEQFINAEIGPLVFHEFVDTCLDAIDVYGMGIALMFWLNNAKKHLDAKHSASLEMFYGRMISIKLSGRVTAEDALIWMEEFLTTSGLLAKHNKEIQDHIVVPHGQGPKVKLIVQVKERAKVNRALAEAEPAACEEGKERNPKTGRCINKCPRGKKRDTAFKCVKDKDMERDTPCPRGKERNPRTKRCVNKCKSGYERNAEFKCTKTRKARSK
jgi:serine/threonine protein kinase